MDTFDCLAEIVKKSEQRVSVGSLYTHYRDNEKLKFYKVLAIAINEEDEEPCVVYQALYGDGLIWVRAVSVWCDAIEYNGKSSSRFILYDQKN
jgi:hypothetical protein